MVEKKHIYTSAVIVAAGNGTRMNSGVAKQFIRIGDKPVLAQTLLVFERALAIDEIIIVTRECDIEAVKELVLEYGIKKVTAVISGGETRQRSAYLGIFKATGEKVLIHDAARPFVTEGQINLVAEALENESAVALGIPVTDTLKATDGDGFIKNTVDREKLYSIQTPQGFRTDIIKNAHKIAENKGIIATDDCALCESIGERVKIIEGSRTNIKITSPDDLIIAEGIIKRQTERKLMRIGHGYDVHKLVENRALILGGVEIRHEVGLLGHSDADVLLHAIMDALLGSVALGDIGKHFPDTDERWRGVSSILLLEKVGELLKEKNAGVVNIDATVIAQKPKLLPYIDKMRENIANALEISKDAVSVKATTTEKLGFCGREEGIAAEAVCMVEMIED